MKLEAYIVIGILLIANMLCMGCVVDLNAEFLVIKRYSDPDEDYLNLTDWDLTPYPTLKKGLEKFVANKSLERKRYRISHEEGEKIRADISRINPNIVYKTEHLVIGTLVS